MKPRIRPPGKGFQKVQQVLGGLHTVCQESHCPNQAECWSSGTATFLILGKVCTRACKFCAVETFHSPEKPDPEEAEKLAFAIRKLGLSHTVITSVDRDDLPDFGAGHFAACIKAAKATGSCVEVLIPDYTGEALETIIRASPDVIAHNLETVERLTPGVRDPRASYSKSLLVLRQASSSGIPTKSSLMLGLGETKDEVLQAMRDLRAAGVSLLTLGQYLQPSKRQLPVKEYLPKERFAFFQEEGEKLGFKVASGPLVRSSYRAGDFFKQ